jgi:alpha-glucosidase (family GH31 glycosyl hydrolase)
MAFAFEDDDEAGKNIYQFMFGPDILVAPVYQPGNNRIVYIPEGKWIDFWNGEIVVGKKYIEVETPLEKIPLYVRAGSIIPLLPDDIQTLVPRNPKMNDSIKTIDDRRILQIWQEGNGSLTTWDGISANLSKKNNSVQFEFSSEIKRPLTIEIMHRDLTFLKIDNALVSYSKEKDKTIISYQSFSDKGLINWGE